MLNKSEIIFARLISPKSPHYITLHLLGTKMNQIILVSENRIFCQKHVSHFHVVQAKPSITIFPLPPPPILCWYTTKSRIEHPACNSGNANVAAIITHPLPFTSSGISHWQPWTKRNTFLSSCKGFDARNRRIIEPRIDKTFFGEDKLENEW